MVGRAAAGWIVQLCGQANLAIVELDSESMAFKRIEVTEFGDLVAQILFI